MHTYLANAFSINMLTREDFHLHFMPISDTYAKQLARRAIQDGNFISVIGHESTAAVLSNMLGINIDAQRVNVEFKDEDVIIVAQYHGPRLSEGATELPDGAVIKFWSVS